MQAPFDQKYSFISQEGKKTKLQPIPAVLLKKLTVFIEKGDLDSLRIQLNANPSWDLDSHNGKLIHTACKHTQLEILKCLVIEFSVNINQESSTLGFTPVHEVVLKLSSFKGLDLEKYKLSEQYKDAKACLKFLIDNHASLTIKRKFDGATALHLACSWNLVEIVKLILNKEPSLVNLETKEDGPLSPVVTPLMTAVHNNSDLSTILILLQSNANPSFVNNEGMTLVHAAVNNCINNRYNDDSVSEERLAILALSLTHFPYNNKDAQGWTPIDLAIKRGCFSAAQSIFTFFLEKNKEASLQGETKEDLEVNLLSLQVCIKRILKLSPLALTENYKRFLIGQISLHDCHAAHLILSTALSLFTLGKTARKELQAWTLEALCYPPQVVDILDIHTACKFGLMQIVKYLHDSGADVESPKMMLDFTGSSHMMTPLQTAISWNQVGCAKFLIDRQVSLIKATGDNQWNALHYACHYDRTHIVGMLLDKFPSLINKTTPENVSPLMLATIAGNTSVVKILLERKADSTIADNNGSTPLHAIADYDHYINVQRRTKIISLLLNAYSHSKEDSNGRTPFMLSLYYAHNIKVSEAFFDYYYTQLVQIQEEKAETIINQDSFLRCINTIKSFSPAEFYVERCKKLLINKMVDSQPNATKVFAAIQAAVTFFPLKPKAVQELSSWTLHTLCQPPAPQKQKTTAWFSWWGSEEKPESAPAGKLLAQTPQ